MCKWLLSLAGSSWPYGIPSSKEQLDSLIALVSRDVTRVGHIRARQLSFGRGCSDGLLLPVTSLVMKTNDLDEVVNHNDFRFFSFDRELENINPGRNRVYALLSNAFLSTLAEFNPTVAQELGCASDVGGSRIGEFPMVDASADQAPVKKQTRHASKTIKNA